jgi:preprotein translocase subunit SecD
MRARPLLACLGVVLGCAGLRVGGAPHLPWEAELLGAGATAAADAPILARRLDARGILATVSVASPDRVRIRAADDLQPDVMRALLAPGHLAIGSGPGALDGSHVSGARVVDDASGMGPQVAVSLTDDGRQRFCALTTANVRQVLPVAVDGRILMEPIVQEPICGGQLMITLGTPPGPPPDAEGLAAALGSGPLKSRWTFESERIVPAP